MHCKTEMKHNRKLTGCSTIMSQRMTHYRMKECYHRSLTSTLWRSTIRCRSLWMQSRNLRALIETFLAFLEIYVLLLKCSYDILAKFDNHFEKKSAGFFTMVRWSMLKLCRLLRSPVMFQQERVDFWEG